MGVKFLGHLKHRFGSVIAYPAADIEGDAIVEIGPGRGDFLFHLAETNPDKCVYGIEIKGKRFDKLVTRREKRKLDNLKLILADAKVALPKLFGEKKVEEIHINFPDPWPKERAAKKRLLKTWFIADCAKVLSSGGTLSITTDVGWYAAEVYKSCQEITLLKSLYDGVTTQSPDAFPTLFAEKWKREGRTIYYQKYSKHLSMPADFD